MALTEQQRAIRKVGGSDVSIILGLSPFKTAVELYHEKRGTLEVVDLSENVAVEAGNVLEDGIAELAENHMTRAWGKPVKLRRSNRTIVNPKYDWLTVHIDRDVVGVERGVELKNVGARAAFAWGESNTDEIPTYYLPQVHTYMLVMDYPVWTVAGYFGGADLRLYEVERSSTWDEIIIEQTRDFWTRVVEGHPPQVDFGGTEQEQRDRAARIDKMMKRLYAGTDGKTVQGDETVEHYFRTMVHASEQAHLYAQTAAGARNHCLQYMKNAATLEFPSLPGWSLSRRLVNKKAYVVDASSYMRAAIKTPKKQSGDEE